MDAVSHEKLARGRFSGLLYHSNHSTMVYRLSENSLENLNTRLAENVEMTLSMLRRVLMDPAFCMEDELLGIEKSWNDAQFAVTVGANVEATLAILEVASSRWGACPSG